MDNIVRKIIQQTNQNYVNYNSCEKGFKYNVLGGHICPICRERVKLYKYVRNIT